MPQDRRITKIKGVALVKKPVCCSFKCPYHASVIKMFDANNNKMVYNASYTKTPFFYLDPYVGLEILLGKISLYFRVDYMLPFGKSDEGLMKTSMSWSNFITPSGPRVYIGCLFGHQKD